MSGDSPGRQGGDLRDLGAVGLDLSTCVNPYGPPEAVLAALRGMSAEISGGIPTGRWNTSRQRTPATPASLPADSSQAVEPAT